MANFTARTTKNFPKLQKKFPEVPEKISRGSMKSFGLCHEIISPVILKSFGLSQDLPLSQNGQNFRRGEREDGANEAMGLMGNGPKFHVLRLWFFVPFTGVSQNIKISEAKKRVF